MIGWLFCLCFFLFSTIVHRSKYLEPSLPRDKVHQPPNIPKQHGCWAQCINLKTPLIIVAVGHRSSQTPFKNYNILIGGMMQSMHSETPFHLLPPDYSALWSRVTKNPDLSTGPPAPPFSHSLAPLSHLLALHCSLCLRAPLCSFVCLLVPSPMGM